MTGKYVDPTFDRYRVPSEPVRLGVSSLGTLLAWLEQEQCPPEVLEPLRDWLNDPSGYRLSKVLVEALERAS
jgi:hypothetical protein